jgi:hypothetical protein
MPEPPFRCQSPIQVIAQVVEGRNLSRMTSPACTLTRAIENGDVHKDKPPGIFDFSDRSMRYAAGFCFFVGFLASVIVRIGVALAREHFSQSTPWSGF